MPNKYKHIINCFSRGEKHRLHQMLCLCSSLINYVNGIEISQNGKRCSRCCIPVSSNDKFCIALFINAHQRRIPKSRLNAFYNKVQSLNFTSKFSCFEDLYVYVANNSGLRKKNCLLVYDFCLRIGYHLNPQILPDQYVYLFQDAKEGAKIVLGKSIRGHRLPTSLFKYALGTSLNSYEIEHLLCVCKPHLQALGAISSAKLNNIVSKVNNRGKNSSYSVSVNKDNVFLEYDTQTNP